MEGDHGLSLNITTQQVIISSNKSLELEINLEDEKSSS